MMDQEELRSKGLFGIIVLSIRLIQSHRRLFLSLAASTILPLSALSLAGVLIVPSNGRYTVGSLLVTLVYSVIHLFVQLLAVGAAIHLAASVTEESASLHESLLRAAPRAWLRLLGTSVWAFLLTVVYALLGSIIIGLTAGLAIATSQGNVVVFGLAVTATCVFGVVFLAGSLYLGVICDLAIAATVIERKGPRPDGSGSTSACWGIAAIKKARALVRGRVIMCCSLVLLFLVPSLGVALCWRITLTAYSVLLVGRIAAGIVILLAHTGLLLLGITLLTVSYLYLKAWHGEKVDPVSLTSGLGPSSDLYQRIMV